MNNYFESQIADLDEKIKQANQLLSDPAMVSLAQEEIQSLENQKMELRKALEHVDEQNAQITEEGSDLDQRNAILEVKGAAGGEEAKMWGNELLHMYVRFAQRL